MKLGEVSSPDAANGTAPPVRMSRSRESKWLELEGAISRNASVCHARGVDAPALPHLTEDVPFTSPRDQEPPPVFLGVGGPPAELPGPLSGEIGHALR